MLFRSGTNRVAKAVLMGAVPPIMLNGVDWFKSMGTEKSPGFTLYSLSGHVTRPGQYEAPLGVTLRQLLDCAGGVRAGHRLKFWTPGGSSTPLLTDEAGIQGALDWNHDRGWVDRLNEAIDNGLTAEAAVERVQNATLIICFKEFPHTDFVARGERTVKNIARPISIYCWSPTTLDEGDSVPFAPRARGAAGPKKKRRKS